MTKKLAFLIPLLLAINVHAAPLHVFLYGEPAQVILYSNGTVIYVGSNETINVQDSTLQVYVSSIMPYSSIFVNGVKTDNLTLLPNVSTLNVTVEPLYFTVQVNTLGDGYLNVKLANSSIIKVNGTKIFRVRAGDLITLYAVPNSGYSVSNWSNGMVGNQIWVMIYNNTNLTVSFSKNTIRSGVEPDISYTSLGFLAILGGVYLFTKRRIQS
ncbi:MAG: hypothetical protein QXX67_03935 [Metallosphaera sp.]